MFKTEDIGRCSTFSVNSADQIIQVNIANTRCFREAWTIPISPFYQRLYFASLFRRLLTIFQSDFPCEAILFLIKIKATVPDYLNLLFINLPGN